MSCAECKRLLTYKCYLLAGDHATILCFQCLQNHNNSEEICWVCGKKAKSRYNLLLNFVKLNSSLVYKLCSTSCHQAQVEYIEYTHRTRDSSKDLYRDCMFCGTSGQNLIRCPKRKIFYYCNENCLRSDTVNRLSSEGIGSSRRS